jgi:hypothetical protein
MRYDGAVMSERPVEISQTYTPGRNLGGTRRVTVDRIPAMELTYDGMTDVAMTFEVCERIDVLIQRGLASNDAAEQRITYTASDPGVLLDPRPWHERISGPRLPHQIERADDRAYAGWSADGSSSSEKSLHDVIGELSE